MMLVLPELGCFGFTRAYSSVTCSKQTTTQTSQPQQRPSRQLASLNLLNMVCASVGF